MIYIFFPLKIYIPCGFQWEYARKLHLKKKSNLVDMVFFMIFDSMIFYIISMEFILGWSTLWSFKTSSFDDFWSI